MALSFGLSLISEAITAGGASLVLPFAGATALDSRITFTRGSNATMVGSNGLIQYAPHNMLLQSEDFSNASWTKFGTATVTPNTAVAPNGTLTADTLAPGTGGIYQAVAAAALTTHVFTIYVRADAATNSRIVINTNLSDPVLQTIAVTTEWQRFQISKTTSAGTTSITGQIDNGAGSNNVYIWGAQLNVGALQPYYPTTSAAYYGPRLVYNPVTLAAQGLLVEEQRTNLLTYSEDLSNAAWLKIGGATVSTNTVIAPDGTLSADTLTISQSKQISQGPVSQAIGTYCFSSFVKTTGATQFYLQLNVPGFASAIDINFTTKTASIRFGTPIAYGVIDYGNGWLRPWIVLTSNAIGSVSGYFVSASVADDTVYAWGAQLEAGAFATSYIPTTTAQATRAADVATMTGTNFSSWYNAAGGTMVVEASVSSAAAYTGYLYTIGSNFNDAILYYRQADSQPVVRIRTGGVDQFGAFGFGAIWTTSSFVNKNALAFTTNSFNSANNTVLAGDDTSGTLPTVTSMSIGSLASTSFFNGTIKSITYYPRRLANTELQALTS